MFKFLRKNWLIILSAIYIVSPIDIIPDFLIGFGLADDFALIAGNILVKFITERKERK